MTIQGFRINNKGRAALVAMRENDKQGEEVPAHYRIADELAKEGLLASDLPEPRFRDANGPAWEIPLHDGLSVVTVRVLYGNVSVGKQGLGFHVNSDEAHQIAAAMLAAAQYAKEGA